MCYRVDCRQCGKYTWGGCGKHLSTLYASIDVGKHCMCRSWPGVVIPSTTNATNNNNNQQPATPVLGYSFSLTFWCMSERKDDDHDKRARDKKAKLDVFG
ncbi:hypothetical protein Godav_027588 [Gossypium davidsonii]|uniref:Uncharacterized protein n=1 Tax=Gossypium davidsonii TaxID=34287 RepID=A0A7J8RWJ8_GOSDV|nr:hypothetical protein [Gossypium davidsonii]